MAGLGFEVGDNLRDFGESPADKTREAESEREVVSQIAETIFEVLFYPPNAWLLLLETIGLSHLLLCSLSYSLAL